MLIKLDTTHSVGDRVVHQYMENESSGNRVSKERFAIVTAVNLKAKVKKVEVHYDILDEDKREYQAGDHELKKFIQ